MNRQSEEDSRTKRHTRKEGRQRKLNKQADKDSRTKRQTRTEG